MLVNTTKISTVSSILTDCLQANNSYVDWVKIESSIDKVSELKKALP